MRISVAALVTFSVMSGLHARPVACPPPSNLWAMADLVAVIEPIASSTADDQLTSAGQTYWPKDPARYQAFDTRCRIQLVMKSPPDGTATEAHELTVMHFGPNGGIEFNGGLFVHFLFPPPTNVFTFIAPEGPSPLQRDRYLPPPSAPKGSKTRVTRSTAPQHPPPRVIYS